jgi:hypothetical protein
VPATVVNIAAVADAREGVVSTPGQMLVSRQDDDLSQALTVHYEVSGTATPGIDYQVLVGSVEIPAGQVSAPIVIQPIDDLIPELPEDVIVSLLAGHGYDLGAARQATVNIRNQETASLIAGTNLTFFVGYTVPETTELPIVTAEVLPFGASFDIVHSEPHPPGAHTFGQFSWTPLLTQVGSHEVVFRVTVPGTDIDETSSLIIQVVPNFPPLVNVGGSAGTETDAQTQQFTWSALDDVGLAFVSATVTQDGNPIFTSADPAGSFNFDAYGPGTFGIAVTAIDTTGQSASASRSVAVSDDDTQGPTIVLGGSTGTENESHLQEFTWDVSDDSGLSVFEVVVSQDTGSGPVEILRTEDLADAVGSFNFDSYGVGTFEISVTATDADNDWSGDASQSSAMQSVTVTAGNSPPVLTVPGPFTVAEGQTLTFQVFAFDPEGDSVAFVAPGLPDGARFDPATRTFDPATQRFSQTLTWSPRSQQAGNYVFTFKASDGETLVSAQVAVTVNDVPLHEQIQPLAERIQSLGELNPGQRVSLLVKLRLARESLERGQERLAERTLESLVNQLDGLWHRPTFSDATKEELQEIEGAAIALIAGLLADPQPRFRADLDVNADKDLNDAVDGVANYLPGYEGTTPKVSTGTTFNTSAYVGQRMRIIVNGAGTNAGITEIFFRITDTTSHAGYAGNGTDPKITGQRNDDDFSFAELRDLRGAGLKAGGDPKQQGGKIEADYAWVDFWCKDYGGVVTVEVSIFAGNQRVGTEFLQAPVDRDNDSIADKWELEKVTEWENRYWVNAMPRGRKIDFFSPANDDEELDPDSPVYDSKKDTDGGTNMPGHKTKGDGLTVFQEYRGFILDGGGHDGDGANPHGGGHLRLSPAVKELLVEVDAMVFAQGITPGIANKPTGGITTVMNKVSQGFSDNDNGAGIRMYWLMDKDNLQYIATFARDADVFQHTKDNRNPNLRQNFVHVQFLSDIPSRAGAFSLSEGEGVDLTANGISIGLDRLKIYGDEKGFAFDGLVFTAVAHELTHQLIEPGAKPKWTPIFILPGGRKFKPEHELDPNENGFEGDAGDLFSVMYNERTNENTTAVKFSNLTRREFDLRNNPGLVRP